jgi:methionyl aminopeptidase
VTIEDDDDLIGLERAGRAVADARDRMLAAIEPGITTAELDRIGERVLRSRGARSAPRLAYGFPGATCISVNDCVAHGIPSRNVVLHDGDLVNVDVSAELDGYWTDTGASAAVGTASPLVSKLLDATRAAQHDAMREARAGRRRRAIGQAVERRAHRSGFSVIANLCGHGVGRNIHEPPNVPNVDDRRDRMVLWEGLVLAIEPFLSTGATLAVEDGDGWSLRLMGGGLAAQFEHTVVVTSGEPLVLTASAA